ncbi:hypothetical protein E1180_12690 [Roseibium denhamense]|uniref:Uncharacterized protein n=1 Tax=Roseibium denhamense TaxID=76305 RepID=A0ABY1NGS3_9HYPH|nr:hypothetical protein [Roseibium denhamense]MTI06373.1 hypothetical protein [Roseibium denhamense]SMP08664.1 hypothetical protein SAMN06265374_1002 [Roseibium denhamense]
MNDNPSREDAAFNWSKREQQFKEWRRALDELSSLSSTAARETVVELQKQIDGVTKIYNRAKADVESGKDIDRAAVKAELHKSFDAVDLAFEKAAHRFQVSAPRVERAPEAV